MSATRITHHLKAPRSAAYRAFVDRDAVAQWMVPTGMTSTIHIFEAREGGKFRVSLTYDAPTGTGKTNSQTDTYHGHFVTLVPGECIVEVMEFESADPAMQGEMTLTVTFSDRDEGTELTVVHDGLPPGLKESDNDAGWRLSLAKLSALLSMQ